MTLTYNNQFEILLRGLLTERATSKTEDLVKGGGVADYAAYREQVGYLRALEDAAGLCDEAHEELEKR